MFVCNIHVSSSLRRGGSYSVSQRSLKQTSPPPPPQNRIRCTPMANVPRNTVTRRSTNQMHNSISLCPHFQNSIHWHVTDQQPHRLHREKTPNGALPAHSKQANFCRSQSRSCPKVAQQTISNCSQSHIECFWGNSYQKGGIYGWSCCPSKKAMCLEDYGQSIIWCP